MIKVLDDKDKAKEAKKAAEGDGGAMADAGMDEKALRAVSRNAPVVGFQMTCFKM